LENSFRRAPDPVVKFNWRRKCEGVANDHPQLDFSKIPLIALRRPLISRTEGDVHSYERDNHRE
jgi:hypothetical protein